MLTTPLGRIHVMIDGKTISYEAVRKDCDKTCMDLGGRYSISVSLPMDKQYHEVACVICGHKETDRDGIESGERLELKSFYDDKSKVSIGMEGDSGYFPEGTRIGEYDYDNEYLPNGVKYIVFPYTKTSVYVFGIAWINGVNDNNDVQTWYGADPTIFS